MDFYYEVLRAHITPEVLGQLNERKIILESTSQQQLKGRYSIVAFEPYGTVKLNNNALIIETLKGTQTITSEPYNYLKSFINQFDCDIDDETLKQLPFISGFIGTCSFDLVRHEFPILQRIAIESNKTTHDATLYMIEDVFVFDHYKDELYVIASNQFSKVSKTELKTRVARNVQSLSH
ncbi:anthranilate synthase component I, partial [Staphylococcus borealis]